jgi:hypothetical protein
VLERLRITSAGRVGVGTSAPNLPLTVAYSDTTAIPTSALADPATGAFQIANTSDSAAYAGIYLRTRTTGSTNALIGLRYNSTFSDGDIFFRVRNGAGTSVEPLTIKASGNVGIGTSAPGQLVQIGEGNTGGGANVHTVARIEGRAVLGAQQVATLEFNQLTNAPAEFVGASIGIESSAGSRAESELVFKVSQATNTSATEAMRLSHDGRLGIGTTNPSGLLHVNGDVFINSTNRIKSTSSSGNLTIQGGSTYPGGHIILNGGSGGDNITFNRSGIAASTIETARIDSSGRLLIGTSSTSAASTVVLQGSSAGSTIQSILTLARGSTSPTDTNLLGSIRFSDSGHASAAAVNARRDGGTWTSGSSQPTYLEFSTTADGAASPTERLRITSAGLVGIGCASPDSLMHLESSSSFLSISNSTDTGEAGILFRRTDNNQNRGLVVYDYTADALKFRASDNGAGEDMRIDSSGRLLIGTSSSVNVGSTASAKLQVGHPTGNVSAAFYCTANSVQGGSLVLGHGRGSTTGVLQSDDTVGDIRFAGADGIDLQSQAATIRCEVDGTPGANDMPGRLVFSTTADGASSPTERMRITSNGFQACTSAGNGIEMGVTASAGTSTQIFRGRHSATAGSYATGTVAFNVFSNGNVQNTNNSYGAISDIKLKENIVDANSQWDDLKALQVRNYNFKEETGQETHTQIGLVAQEVELVSPGLVSESPDRDEDGNDLGTVTKSVNYSVLYMKAVKALQEAMERIETLEQRLNDAGTAN